MATFNHIGGAEPSTVTFKLATVTQTRNSSVMHQEIMALGDPDSSLALAAVLNAIPASSVWGLVVRPVGNSSIQGNCTVVQGTSPWVIAGNSSVAQASTVWEAQITNQVRVSNSTAADLLVQISGNSTAIIQGNSTVAPLAGSTWNTRPIQSSAGDLQMTATPAAGSTWNVRPVQSSAADHQVTATIGTNLQSSVMPSSGSSGLIVRQVIDGIATFASTSALATTSAAVTSSAANLRSYVTAYTITSTNQTPAHWGFYSSNATLLWPMTIAALSSGVAGANLASAAPAYLFRTAAGEALNFKTAGSTVAGVQMGVSYFTAP